MSKTIIERRTNIMAIKRTAEKIVEVKKLTAIEIQSGIKKITKRIEEVRGLSEKKVTHDDARVETAKTNIRETIRDVFGQYSPEFYDFQYYDIWDGDYVMGDDEFDMQGKYEAGIPKTILLLEGLIDRLKEKLEDIIPVPSMDRNLDTESANRVFIVHGHDNEAKEVLARFIEKMQLEPIILSEMPSEGKAIIDKFESNTNVGFAIVLLTPDEVAFDKEYPENKSNRARQNVILELGYFIGKLGRSKVRVLYKKDVEIPSDYHGVEYIAYDATGGWKLRLAAEMKNAGIQIDMNKAI
jgi:predicted nucleotide-binding protein